MHDHDSGRNPVYPVGVDSEMIDLSSAIDEFRAAMAVMGDTPHAAFRLINLADNPAPPSEEGE
jgi:hypothetical protein